MPMHTVYKGRRKQHSWLQGGPTGATYDCSDVKYEFHLQSNVII